MSRRRTPVNRFVDGNRASIGDNYVDTACAMLEKACKTEIAMFVEPLSRADLIPMIIPDHIAELLRAAHPFCADPPQQHTYDMQPFAPCRLHVDYTDTNILPASVIHTDLERWQPLRDRIECITELSTKWGAVKHVLRWCNRFLTPGAIRNIWPSAMALCPTSPAMVELQRAPPTRYDSPKDLGPMLPLVRYTAGIVAGMAMMPTDVGPRAGGRVRLTFPSRVATVEGCSVSVDGSVFNIG